ncbi:colicin immunity protein Cui [Serratia sp. FGI94]|uniref:colicin immunity protein Cui n=1 Tax=Serratia sp. FGI94 TaxID=671990 RepID=UPI0008FF9815|nr:colicin immunity protein Cui [Serratia sp. FGI94]
MKSLPRKFIWYLFIASFFTNKELTDSAGLIKLMSTNDILLSFFYISLYCVVFCLLIYIFGFLSVRLGPLKREGKTLSLLVRWTDYFFIYFIGHFCSEPCISPYNARLLT